MTAVRTHDYGDARGLAHEEAPVPPAGPSDAPARIVAAPVCLVDWKLREGCLRRVIPYVLPLNSWF